MRRTSATCLVDGGGNENELMRLGGWKSATIARSYGDKSTYNQLESNKKITKVIDLKASNTTTNMMGTSNDSSKPSTSKANPPLVRDNSSKPSTSKRDPTVVLKELSNISNSNDLQSKRSETPTGNDNEDPFANRHLSLPTSTQLATCGTPPPKKAKENLDPVEN